MTTAVLTGNRTLEVTDFMSPETRAANNEPPREEPIYEPMTTAERRAKLKELEEVKRENKIKIKKARDVDEAAKKDIDNCNCEHCQNIRKAKETKAQYERTVQSCNDEERSRTSEIQNDVISNLRFQEAYAEFRAALYNERDSATGQRRIDIQSALNGGYEAFVNEADPVAAIRKLCAELKVRI